jgi:phosphonatase-like hydrolase
VYPELVVLDMAGTTVYDGDAVHTCLGDALRGADVPATRDAINVVMGLPKPLAIRRLLERGAADPAAVREETVRTIYADFQRRMLAYYRADPAVREIEGTSAMFRTLREAGLRIALDTGFARPIADAVLERLGWARSGLLDATVTSDEVANGRPHPDMIFRAMALTGVTEARRVAKVGDTPSDLQEGQAAGCGWVIGVTEGSHTREQLAPYPHTHLIRTVAALPSCLLEDRQNG